MANKEFLDTRHDSELCRMRLYVTYSVSSQTQTAITYSVSAVAQVKSNTAGSVIRGDNSATWGMAISDSGGFYGGNCVTWDEVSAKSVTCSSANTWYTVYTFSAKSITIQKGSTTQSLLVYAPLDALINSGTYPEAFLDLNGAAIVSGIAKISYTVSYNANGGSGAPANQTKVYGEALKLSSTVPTKSGWTFAGWATSSSSSSVAYAAGASYTGNAALALYAVWKRVITVSYNANGGSGAPANQQVTIYNSATSGNITITTARPSRGNFAFLGWAGSSTATTVTHNPGSSYSFSSNTVLYAVWDAAPSINSLTVVRCDSNGHPADEGTYALVTCNWYLDGTLGDSATLSGTITPQSGGSATAFTFDTGSSGSGSVTATALISPVDPDMQYTVLVTAANGNNTSTRSAILTRAFFVMDWKAGGRAVGIGRAAPDNGLEVGYETVFDGNVDIFGPTNIGSTLNTTGKITSNNYVQATQYMILKANSSNYAAIRTIPSSSGGRSSDAIKFYSTLDNADGDEIVVCNGGQVIIGAGESGNNLHTALGAAVGSEQLHLASDSSVNIYSTCNTIANRLRWQFNSTANAPYIYADCGAASSVAIDTSTTNGVTASANLGGYYIRDKNAYWTGVFGNRTGSSGDVWAFMGARNKKADGTDVTNYIQAIVNKDGSQTYSISSPTNFRSAISAAASSHTHSYVPVPTQLYNNATGVDGTVSLSQTAANFNYLRIFYKKHGDTNACGSTVVYAPNGKKASLVIGNWASPTLQIAWKVVSISAQSITVVSQNYIIENTSSGAWNTGVSDAKVYIYRVEGWK